LQRIRELEARLDFQKRQVKDIEEKVNVHIICFYLERFVTRQMLSRENVKELTSSELVVGFIILTS